MLMQSWKLIQVSQKYKQVFCQWHASVTNAALTSAGIVEL